MNVYSYIHIIEKYKYFVNKKKERQLETISHRSFFTKQASTNLFYVYLTQAILKMLQSKSKSQR